MSNILTIYIGNLLLCLILSINSAQAKQQIAGLNMSVDANKWAGIRLRNLNEDATLHILLKIDDQAEIYFLNSLQYSLFPNLKHKALFHASIKNTLELTLKIPKTDHYVLIIDNRRNGVERHFTINFNASLDSINAAPKSQKNIILKKVNRQLTTFSKSLNNILIFDHVEIQLGKCGVANAFNKASNIYLCAEYVASLQTILQEKEKIQNILMFTLMHEMGHVLLRQWGNPSSENEQFVDEFSAVILMMLGHPSVATTQAEFFAKIPTKLEIIKNFDRQVSHPLSAQRASNILKVIESDDTIRKWQALLIPHMQTAYLRYLTKQPDNWIDHDLLNKEISNRQN